MHGKKEYALFAVFLLVLLSLASCGPGASVPAETEPVPPDAIILAGPERDTACTVTYPADSGELKAAADGLTEYVNAVIPGAGLLAAADGEDLGTEYEIAILAPDPALSAEYAVKLDGTRITLQGKDLAAASDAVNYFKAYCVADGCLFVDKALDFSSAAGPEVLSQSPERCYYYEDVYTPALIYTFDKAAVDTARSRLIISGREVTRNAVWSKGSVTLSGYAVEPGEHTVLLALAGKKGAVKVFETAFSCGDGSVMHLYAGEVHSHTSDSDGQGTVEEAYVYARDTAGLDYFAVTDHSGYLSASGVYQEAQIPNADSFNEPGRFAALYGYEQTYSINTGYYGHCNTLNHASVTTWELTLREYYAQMAQDGDAVVMFNHPGYSWGNFIEYDYCTPENDAVIDLIEIKNRSAADYEYPLALTRGWHVSPVYNEDNHAADWGAAREACGFALAPALTRQNIIDAFRKNRTYTTTDMSLRVYYQINGEWMGGRLDDPDELHLTARLSTEKAYGLGKISVIAEDGIVVAAEEVGREQEYTLELDLPPLYDYYYLSVESAGAWCYTAPIWIENREQLTVDAVYHELLADNSGKHRAYAAVTNQTDRMMTGAAVDFYTAPRTGFSLLQTEPVYTARIGDLAPGETATVCADLSYEASAPRIYAVASGTQDGREYGAVKYTELSTLYVTEILPYTSGSDAYEFIELYNNSNAVLDLSGYNLRYYPKAGLKASDLAESTWMLSGRIQPHSAMVLWRVSSDDTRTIADFNDHFGTNLTEGRDIVILKGRHFPSKKPVQIELYLDETVVGRIWYNWGGEEDVTKDRAILYSYPQGLTITARVEQADAIPTPGRLGEGQVPGIVRQPG